MTTGLDRLLTDFEEASICLHVEDTRSAQDRWEAAGDAIRAEFDRLRAEVESLNVELAEGPIPVLLGWETAPFDEVCGWCPNGIDKDGRVAILSTAHRVCVPCASGRRRGV